MKKIKWSAQAEKTYDRIIEDILLKWNSSIAKSFISEVEDLLVKLADFNNLCPKSKVKQIRKCTISEQTALVYKIQREFIYLVAFVPNRTNHRY